MSLQARGRGTRVALLLTLLVLSVVILWRRSPESGAALLRPRPSPDLPVRPPHLVGAAPEESGTPDGNAPSPSEGVEAAAGPDPSYPEESVTLDVEVVDDTGRPISLAHVRSLWGSSETPGAWTDQRGRCALPSPVHARSLVVDGVELPSGDPRRFALVTYWVLDDAERDVRIVVRTYAPVTGRIVDGTGTPIPGAYIAAHDDRSREGLGPSVGGGVSGPDGRFQFDVASANSVDLVFEGRCDDPSMTELRGSLRRVRPGSNPVVLRASKPGTNGSLDVCVRSRDGPVVNANVLVLGTHVRSSELADEAGVAKLRGLLEWPCLVVAQPRAADARAGLRSASVGSVELDGRRLDVWLRSSSSIRGQVLGAEGSPLENAAVRVYVGNVGMFFATDKDGRFEGRVEADPSTILQVSAEWPLDPPTQWGYAAEARAGIDEPVIRVRPWSGARNQGLSTAHFTTVHLNR